MNVLRIASVCIVAALLALSVAIGINQATAFQSTQQALPSNQ